MNISRRAFMAFSAAAVAAPLLGARRVGAAPAVQVLPFGRVLIDGLAVRDSAAPSGTKLKTYGYNEVITILGAVEGESDAPHNKAWYQTPDGYVYSAYVQPVEDAPQAVEWNVPPQGFWAEVSVPLAESRGAPSATAWRSYKLYYSTVYRVMSVVADETGAGWYGLAAEVGGRPSYYVPATTMRRIYESDLTPLSPGVEKLVKVNLTAQVLEAYEAGQLVFSGRVASGAVFRVNGQIKDYRTRTGQLRVLRKAWFSHMRGGTPGGGDYYDLPGVPFCTYITGSGIAVHGAYWHNDFGRPRSHGCLNMLASEARWMFRWTEPMVPYDTRQILVPAGTGTKFEVFY